MNFLALFVLSLSAWRIGSLLAHEDGPYEILARFRRLIGVYYDERSNPHGANVVAKAAICVWCNSVWISTILVVAYYFIGDIFLWCALPLAVSALAIVVEEWLRQA